MFFSSHKKLYNYIRINLKNVFIVVKVETTLDYNVNVTLPDFNFTLSLVFTTMSNDNPFLTIENVTIDEISNSVKAQNQNPTPTVYTRVDENITTRVVMDFGKLGVNIS